MKLNTKYALDEYLYRMSAPDQQSSVVQSLSETERKLVGRLDDNVKIYRWGDALIIDRFKCPECGCEKTAKHVDTGIVECAWCRGEGRVIKPKPEPAVMRDNSWRPFLPPR